MRPDGRELVKTYRKRPDETLWQVESELDRLGFTRREILPTTSNPKADTLLAKHLGPLVEKTLVRYVQSAAYQRLSEALKALTLSKRLATLRESARAQARKEDPQLFRFLQYRGKSERERRVLEERGYAVPAR